MIVPGIMEQMSAAGGAAPSNVPIFKARLYSSASLPIGNTYTFASQDIGVAHGSRLVILAWTRISSLTGAPQVNGVNMTLVASITWALWTTSIYYALIPTGTTATFSYTVAGGSTCPEFFADYWIAYPSVATPVDFNSNSGSVGAITATDIATQASGFVIGAAASTSLSYGLSTWSGGGTPTLSQNNFTGEDFTMGVGMVALTTALSTGDLTADGSSGSRCVLGVSWGASA